IPVARRPTLSRATPSTDPSSRSSLRFLPLTPNRSPRRSSRLLLMTGCPRTAPPPVPRASPAFRSTMLPS
ncbi:hypothetical protein BGX29_004361, partial [Mortierella sp. GBA35]